LKVETPTLMSRCSSFSPYHRSYQKPQVVDCEKPFGCGYLHDLLLHIFRGLPAREVRKGEFSTLARRFREVSLNSKATCVAEITARQFSYSFVSNQILLCVISRNSETSALQNPPRVPFDVGTSQWYLGNVCFFTTWDLTVCQL